MSGLCLFLLTCGVAVALTRGQTVEYDPGNLASYELGMYLSKGMNARIIARSGAPVQYGNGNFSTETMHYKPDGAAVFVDERPNNPGGWIYVSNSEVDSGGGGVGAFTFDADGNVIDYRMILTGTYRNCNGGKTKWNTWISCEEDVDNKGKAWQVDPYGIRKPEVITLGKTGGNWESFAHDTRDETKLYAFLTEDNLNGAVQRMTIENPNYTNPWDILLGEGKIEYLILEEADACENGTEAGYFSWTTDEAGARANAAIRYPFCEGMEMDEEKGLLRIVSKVLYGIFTLNLDLGTYIFEETDMEGQPDQLFTVEREDGTEVTYLTEESPPIPGVLGHQVGLYTRTVLGGLTANIVFGDGQSPETTGIAMSPDYKRLYFTFQVDGVLYELTRTDGLTFLDESLSSNCLTRIFDSFRNSVLSKWQDLRMWLLYGYSKAAVAFQLDV